METISELEAHQRAYLQIFRAVLKKKNATPDQARVLMAKLQQYISTRIKTPDEFLDHIPTFARGLAVKPEVLSAFIGSNLLPALESVKKQMREAAPPPEPAGPAISDAEVAHSVFKEIERDYGSIVPEHMRFNGEDMGLLRLVSLNGGQDIPSKSLQSATGVAAPAAAPAASAPAAEAAPAAAPAAGATPVTGGAAAAGASAPAPVSLKEPSIIAQILEQFGEELTVTGPLQVSAFPRESGAAAPGSAPAGPAAGVAPAAGASADGAPGSGVSGAAPAAEAMPAAAPGFEAEPSIIGEILERFGEELTVTGPLVLREEAGGGAGAAAMPAAGAAPGTAAPAAQAAAAPGEHLGVPPVEHPEVPLNFQQYVETVRQIQEFQSKGDQAGYRNWLNASAGPGGKALVGLRNVDAKARKGGEIHWDDEYYNIANHMSLAADQIRNLHQRIRRYQQLQQLLNQFIGGVKARDAALVGGVKKIWPQVRLLFNEEWSAEAMMSRLKIPLLQIADPALKQQVQELMLPLLQKAESLAKGS